MGRLDAEARGDQSVVGPGSARSEIARLLGVTEGAVRYHAKRMAAGRWTGGAAAAEGGGLWRRRSSTGAGSRMAAAWGAAAAGLAVREHGYDGSLRSVQRYWRRTFPAPAVRARRPVETPAGAQGVAAGGDSAVCASPCAAAGAGTRSSNVGAGRTVVRADR